MTPEMLIFIGAIAAIISIATFRGGLAGTMSPHVAVVAATAAVCVWLVFAYASLDVTIDTYDGDPVTASWTVVAMFGAIAAGLSAVMAVWAGAVAMGDRS